MLSKMRSPHFPAVKLARENNAVVESFVVSVYKKRKEDLDICSNELRFTLYHGAANDNLRDLRTTTVSKCSTKVHTKEYRPSWLGLGQYFVTNKHRLTRCSLAGVEPE